MQEIERSLIGWLLRVLDWRLLAVRFQVAT